MVINLGILPPSDIPEQWIYRFYLDQVGVPVREPMDGRRITIKSIFQKERTPSFILYVRGGKYRWKDFSSGRSGNAWELVKQILTRKTQQELKYPEIYRHVRNDYRQWMNDNGHFEEEALDTDHFLYDLKCETKTRPWNSHDFAFWRTFNIGESLLDEYNIVPLAKFQLVRVFPDKITKYLRPYSGDFSYGFFSQNGDLIKIYNPLCEDFKHITLKKQILGLDQLKNVNKNLIIGSSMKDILAMKSLGLALDFVAPLAESILISGQDIDYLKSIYENIFTLFDNDKAGVQSMIMYKKTYDLPYIYLPHYKDVAEFISKDDTIYVKHEIAIRINKKLNLEIGDALVKHENTFYEKFQSRHPY